MNRVPANDELLESLERDTFAWFWKSANPVNGLVLDSTRTGSPSSIAAVGLALTCYPVGVERGFVSRQDAAHRTLATLRFFRDGEQSPGPDAIGLHGFYYHFLEMATGRRTPHSEVSTIDTTYLLAGALAAARYFDRRAPDEDEIREIADGLYRRADWHWALAGGPTVSHGWTPEDGFLEWRWQGYSEALLLYVLGLGSPTYPLPVESYRAWADTYEWRELYGIESIHAGPMFIHQLSHVWLDFRGIQDEFTRQRGIDYFENSRRATFIQREYAVRNPRGFRGYGENLWGLTASDGPGPAVLTIDGVERRFHDYAARAVPDGPDDGTIAPWAVTASLPFAPEIVLPAIRHLTDAYGAASEWGFRCSINPTFPDSEGGIRGWLSSGHYGLDQGPIVLMIENYRTGFVWRLLCRCPYVVDGLRRAGFRGGWLDHARGAQS